jgi:hypothetical protein
MAGTTVFTAGQVLSAASLNGNFDKLPYAFAAGTATALTGALAADGTATVSVTFPASRFAVAPIVTAWTSGTRYIATATTIAAGSATISLRNVSAATGSTETVYYQAVQMTAGTAAG